MVKTEADNKVVGKVKIEAEELYSLGSVEEGAQEGRFEAVEPEAVKPEAIEPEAVESA